MHGFLQKYFQRFFQKILISLHKISVRIFPNILSGISPWIANVVCGFLPRTYSDIYSGAFSKSSPKIVLVISPGIISIVVLDNSFKIFSIYFYNNSSQDLNRIPSVIFLGFLQVISPEISLFEGFLKGFL